MVSSSGLCSGRHTIPNDVIQKLFKLMLFVCKCIQIRTSGFMYGYFDEGVFTWFELEQLPQSCKPRANWEM